jgi:hypothetical protein
MKRAVVSVGLLLALAVALPAAASTFLAMSQKDLLQHSTRVVQGEVLQVNSFWEPEGRLIVSEALVRVEEAVVGEAASVVVVRTFGGTVDGFTVEAHGFPTFRVNERLLLFLGAEKDGAAEVVGYQQGQFRVVRNRVGEEIAVPAVDGGANLLTVDGRPLPRLQAMPLAALKDSIRADVRSLGPVNRVSE